MLSVTIISSCFIIIIIIITIILHQHSYPCRHICWHGYCRMQVCYRCSLLWRLSHCCRQTQCTECTAEEVILICLSMPSRLRTTFEQPFIDNDETNAHQNSDIQEQWTSYKWVPIPKMIDNWNSETPSTAMPITIISDSVLPTPNFIASSQNLLSAAISGLDCLAKNTLSALSRSLHCESKKKQFSWLLITTSTNVHRFPKFFHWQNPEKILQTNIINISTSPEMFLHYLVKLHNYNCCRFQWHIARETLEFILQAMRLP